MFQCTYHCLHVHYNTSLLDDFIFYIMYDKLLSFVQGIILLRVLGKAIPEKKKKNTDDVYSHALLHT